MNKKMSRFKGLILSCLSVLMIAFSIYSFSFESKASTDSIIGQEFKMNFPRPSTSDTQGYIHLLLKRDDSYGSGYYVQTFFWSCYAVADDASVSPCNGYVILDSDKMQFVPWGASKSNSAFYVISAITQNGTFSTKNYSSSQRYTYNPEGKIVGYKFGGNALVDASFSNYEYFTVYYTEDESAELLYEVIDKLSLLNSQQILDSHSLWVKLNDILSSSLSMDEKIVDILDYLESIEDELIGFSEDLDYLKKRADRIVDLQKDTNTWLEKIWNSIQEFFTPDEEDEKESSKLESETNDKTDKLDGLNEQNKTDKTDINNASGSVDENIDLDSVDNYGSVLSVVTGNTYVLQLLLIVFSFALVAYVLFGKKK